ncbi:hypothetical protein [Cohnella boryungensis]|uniref:Uncharacterized protein n=1 Tax=Cohnella boryungensis TaxID=768479 RepID=A0ABV8SFN6_9BACL
MPEMTSHIGLKKPLKTEIADISVLNENMDIIDLAMGHMASVPTLSKNAAGAISELHEAISGASGGDNQTVRNQVALLLETDTRRTVFEYTGGLISAIVEKDETVEVARTTLNYTGGALAAVVEVAGGKTVTSTINRDGNGNIVDITKGVN